ncbi:PaaX family transcriptional regulator [Microvirga lotononidis]|uniref:Phenylacetic acid-responsive transcriptional repressor n=1 Tax=Microvirga lotononidis TaxID=864069 RepID=I4YLP0_9HYPH|nr:PaaX family transcriptional regulator C-terminal domain-containing protein [Microvirga lotononidis]EIM24882.1 phenylacetic acid-responsive transcriptional repressor [Microvirga lotononidis]WQO29617.1 PaaX family transcriptional regulator C-terminal domain-containing protein [Microvirga lotononidis]
MVAFVETLLDKFHERTPIRAGSLIVTVFGDAVVPRGGVLSLTSLHEIMRAFRISDTLVRTALSRLVSEGWFERWKVGRNSYYRLTPHGQEAFAQATRRIYADQPQDWQGSFDLLLLDNAQDRSALRSELTAAGYGALGPDLLLAAAASTDGTGPFLRLSATPADPATARRLVERAWPLAEIESRYRRFIETYSGILRALTRGAGFANLDALLVRILLIHDYRRSVLKDPLLPAQLLPQPWAGVEARTLCGTIYRTLLPAAERWIDTHAQNDTGPLPSADRDFGRRFASAEPVAALKIG